MSLTKYDVILNNCGARTVFEAKVFDKLLKKYIFNWKKIILKRHHEFIESYLNHKGNLKEVGKELKYPVTDLRAIFLRIQSQFELYDEDNTLTFMDMVMNVYGLPIIAGELDFIEFKTENKKEELKKKSVLEQVHSNQTEIIDITDQIINQVSNSVVVEGKYNLETLIERLKQYNIENQKTPRLKKIEHYRKEFKKLESLDVVKNIVSSKMYGLLQGLVQDRTLDQIAEEIDSSTAYLIPLLLGCKNPRSKSEYGIVRIIEMAI